MKGHRTSAFRSGVILASPDLLAIAPFACSVGVSNVLGDPHTPSPLQQSACARAAACTSLNVYITYVVVARCCRFSGKPSWLARIVHLQRSLYERVILARGAHLSHCWSWQGTQPCQACFFMETCGM